MSCAADISATPRQAMTKNARLAMVLASLHLP
jgi:hypothetical protein